MQFNESIQEYCKFVGVEVVLISFVNNSFYCLTNETQINLKMKAAFTQVYKDTNNGKVMLRLAAVDLFNVDITAGFFTHKS